MNSTIDATTQTLLEKALVFSGYMQRMLNGNPADKAILLNNLKKTFQRDEMENFLQHHQASIKDEADLNRVLRLLRKHVMLRLITRDIGGLADLAEVMCTMTDLAEISIHFALWHHYHWLAEPGRFGIPVGKTSSRKQPLLVVAMGKLGGR